MTGRRFRQFRIVAGAIPAILLRLLHDVVEAFADALAPADALHVKSLDPGIHLYRDDALRRVSARLRVQEDAAESAPGMSDADLFGGPLGLRSLSKSRRRRRVIGFSVSGKAGTTQQVSVQPQCLFQGVKLVASDDSDEARSTFLTGLFVGAQSELPVATGLDGGIPTAEFAYDKCNNDLLLNPCLPGVCLTLQIAFRRDCTLTGALFGDALFGDNPF